VVPIAPTQVLYLSTKVVFFFHNRGPAVLHGESYTERAFSEYRNFTPLLVRDITACATQAGCNIPPELFFRPQLGKRASPSASRVERKGSIYRITYAAHYIRKIFEMHNKQPRVSSHRAKMLDIYGNKIT